MRAVNSFCSTRWRGDDQVHVVEPLGIYRERKGWGDQDNARVKYDEHQELDLPEDRIRAGGLDWFVSLAMTGATDTPRFRSLLRPARPGAGLSEDAQRRSRTR